MITRRCSERRFFLQPSALVFQVFVYALALAAWATGAQLHAVVVMGNHYHLVVTDVHGNLPVFYHRLHLLVSKCLNASRGRWENMWSIEETNRVSLEDLEAVIDKVGYTLCNPVSALLISKGAKWPGLRAWWADGPIEVERPDVYFSERSALPDRVTLEFVAPPAMVEAFPDDDGVAMMSEYLAKREQRIRDRARRNGQRFVGLPNLRKQNWWECPTSFAKRRGLRPRVATRSKWRRIEAIARNRAFVAAYREAREAWLRGERDVVWPAGTYQMRILHNVTCAPLPATS